jgi:hypothetical protein
MPAAAYSYAIVRVVPRVERGEFVNAGVVLHCPERGFLAARAALDRERVLLLHPEADLVAIESHLQALQALCAGDKAGAGPLAALPLSERFHWAVAPRSTIIQTSPVHGGVTEDPAAALEHLLQTVVR